jgi:hypothetical protein
MKIAPIKKLLSRVLDPEEVEIVIDVLVAEECGEKFSAGRLGYSESLIRRNWLIRNADGSVTLSRDTRDLIRDQSGSFRKTKRSRVTARAG